LLRSELMRRAITFALISLAATACTDEVHEVVVASTMTPCYSPWPSLCLQQGENGASPSITYSGGIDGFEFRWGVETTLRYHVEDIEQPLADGPSELHILDEVIAVRVEAPGTTFTTRFLPAETDDVWFEADVPGVVGYFGTPVACEAAICDQLVAPQVVGSRRDVTFEHTGLLVPLRATAVQPVP